MVVFIFIAIFKYFTIESMNFYSQGTTTTKVTEVISVILPFTTTNDKIPLQLFYLLSLAWW